MNETTMEMAHQAGLRIASVMDDIDPRNVYLHELERFAALVRADEREENAKVCDAEATVEGIAQKCAAAIRARGNR